MLVLGVVVASCFAADYLTSKHGGGYTGYVSSVNERGRGHNDGHRHEDHLFGYSCIGSGEIFGGGRGGGRGGGGGVGGHVGNLFGSGGGRRN